MMADNKLELWLNGAHIGQLEQLRNRSMRLRFTPEVISEHGAGTPLLSLAVKLTPKRTEGPSLERFIDGLLPESRIRSALERENGLYPNDSFGLLRVLGSECAGAVQFTPEGAEPGPGFLREMGDDEVAQLIRNLPTLTPPDGLPITASLGGVQAKVLLTKTDSGWAWPANGAMSTHIIKPEPVSDVVVPHLIESEDWTLRLARAIGISTARAEILDFDGRRAIVVERYDRVNGRRLHQEDFAQALGVATSDKYESSVRPPTRLLTIAQEAGAYSISPKRFIEDLLTVVAFNVTIGNGDAHSKNYSLTISSEGEHSIAPLYDAAPVFLMNRSIHHAGHAVGGQVDLKYVKRGHIVDEAVSWGMTRSRAETIVTELTEAVTETAPSLAITEDISHLPELVARRAKAFASAAGITGSQYRGGSQSRVGKGAPDGGEFTSRNRRESTAPPLRG